MFFNSLNNAALIFENPKMFAAFVLFLVWSLAWKGFALWKSAKNNQKKWFIAILILNTLGLLEIIYLFYFCKPKEHPLQDVRLDKDN